MIQELLYLLPVAIFSLSGMDYETTWRFAFQVSIALASGSLLYFMLKYTGKKALDISLLLRELAIIALFIRSAAGLLFDYTPLWLTFGSYLFLAICCVAVSIFLINEHRPRTGRKESTEGVSLLSTPEDTQGKD